MVDYPGEWLLDLPLLDQSYAEFSADALEKAEVPARKKLAKAYLKAIKDLDTSAPLEEPVAAKLASLYTDYLRSCREGEISLSMLPPGRFLMPGDLEGSPALTFAPLPPIDGKAEKDSLYQSMERRFEAYKRVVVKPFFINHFARLDRQVVLVDTLSAMNAGPEAMADLRDALAAIMACFKPGKNSFLSSILGPRVDRIAFAATKADHLHQYQHDQLEAILDHLVDEARRKALFSGAEVRTLALASVRSTREAQARQNGHVIKAVAGVPMEGESIDGEVFDGKREVAIFPGNLPTNPASLLRADTTIDPIRFVKFRPPKLDVFEKQRRGVMDAQDLIVIAEETLMEPLDREAVRLASSASRRVSLVTALSPRALVDIAMVAFQCISLTRQIAELYGARPGFLGGMRLIRHMIAHLAITGGIAATEGLVSQVLGHSVAARLSTRLGEGVINGLLTARVGVAAIAVMRPMPYIASGGPTLSEVTRGMASLGGDSKLDEE
eukprot:g17473.t1